MIKQRETQMTELQKFEMELDHYIQGIFLDVRG